MGFGSLPSRSIWFEARTGELFRTGHLATLFGLAVLTRQIGGILGGSLVASGANIGSREWMF